MYIFSDGESSVYLLWAKKQKQRIKRLCIILYYAFFYCCHLNLMTLAFAPAFLYHSLYIMRYLFHFLNKQVIQFIECQSHRYRHKNIERHGYIPYSLHNCSAKFKVIIDHLYKENVIGCLTNPCQQPSKYSRNPAMIESAEQKNHDWKDVECHRHCRRFPIVKEH